MKIGRAILAGSLVWFFVFSVFAVFSFVPSIKDSALLQALIIGILIIPFAIFGTTFYYKKGDDTNGLTIGFVMIVTALILDVLITVPLVEIPYNNSSYKAFFTNPLLWMLVVENLAVIFLYWKFKLSPTQISLI
jgi:hypothetical protein